MYEPTSQQLKDAIKNLLAQHGESVASFARKIGMSQKGLNNQLNGDTAVSLSVMLSLSSIYGVSIDTMLGITDEDKSGTHEERIPVYHMPTPGKLNTLFGDHTAEAPDYMTLPGVSGSHIGIRMAGSNALVKAGDIIALREIKDLSFLVPGELYAVDFEVGSGAYTLLCFVHRASDGTDRLELTRPGDDPRPMLIDQSSIKTIALVKVIIQYRIIL